MGHDTCHFFHALPLKLAPTCFTKQCGTSRIRVHMVKWVANNAQHKYMSYIIYIEHVQIKSPIFLVKIVVRRFASHIFDTFNKKWRQMNPKKKTREWSNFLFYFQKCPFGTYIKKIINTFTFGAWTFFLVHIQFTLNAGPKTKSKPSHSWICICIQDWKVASLRDADADPGRTPTHPALLFLICSSVSIIAC